MKPNPADRVWLTDHFDMEMLPTHLPVTLIFREITIEVAKKMIKEMGQRSGCLDPDAVHILMAQMEMTILGSRHVTFSLRSYEAIIIAQMNRPPSDTIPVWKKLTREEILRIPITFYLAEIVDISPDSL